MPGFANRAQIRAAAERCGLSNFEGNRAGANYDANVPRTVPGWGEIEDCIYDDLGGKGLKATRIISGDNPPPSVRATRGE